MKILDLEIDNKNTSEILYAIENKLAMGKNASLLYVNAYIALEARKSISLKNDLNKFSTLYSDGIGIYFASNFLYKNKGLSKRVDATGLHFKILEIAEKKSYGMFFLGGSEKAANSLESQVSKLYPKLIIKGILPRNLELDEKILNEINSSKADILFLGLGTPYQEKWIATLGQKCNIPIQIAVGSGIDFVAGTYKRAPKLMRLLGLEWLFRLFLEPKRLWKRYLIGIPHFVYLIIKQKYSRKKYRD